LGVRPLLQHLQEYGLLAVFILEFVFFALASEHFLTPDNLINVTLQTSIIAIIAAGMTFVILTAGLDLSVGIFIGAMLIGVDSYVQQVVLGIVILLAVLLDQFKKRET
jgi:ribose/xylose/arabinose/galactoside ABC-type transport system permease subunit